MGQVPVMKIGEEVFCQQRAIEDYAAKKAGLLGKTDEDQMKIEMIMETMNEIYLQGFIKAFMTSTVEFPPSAEHPFMMADNTPENRVKRAKSIGLNAGKNTKGFETETFLKINILNTIL